MTVDNHVRFGISGLLDGSVDPAAVQAWPAWAREHVRACPECLSLVEVERDLRRALVATRGSSRRLATPAERHARLARRQPLPPAALAGGENALPRRPMRNGVPALELVRTSRGIRLWHPDATEALVLAAGADMPPAAIRHAREITPGVGLDIEFKPDRGAEVLAVAAREALQPEHWVLWLRDAIASGKLGDLVSGCASDFLQLARVTIPPPMRASLLRLRPDALPEATPTVAALLKRAAQAGRDDRVLEATTLYQQALEAAFSANDVAGQVKAAMGLGLALRGLGYEVDGDRVLRWLVETHALDRKYAGMVCRHLATDALNRMDIDTAEQWLTDAETFEGPASEWLQVLLLKVASMRGHDADVDAFGRSLARVGLPAATRRAVTIHRAIGLARGGEVAEARALIAGGGAEADPPLELRIESALCEAICCARGGDREGLGAVVAQVERAVAEKDGGLLSSWDQPPLLLLADEARRAGEHAAALRAFRLRFLDTARARDPSVHLLGLAASHDRLLLCCPGGEPRLRSVPLPRHQVHDLVARSRDELRGLDRLDACRELGTLLVSNGSLRPGPCWVGSDGLLSEVPLLAVALSVASESQVPALRELVGPRRPPPERAAGASAAIASLADALGDLPWAAREVERGEAALWLRGKEVRRERLRLAEHVGLLHLGLHARREQGLPQLLFADGPLGPVEIASIPLRGAPVVVLAGCATGVARTASGVERSLADAFLRAGASAVVGTRWPVDDREILPFVRALVEAWPFDDVAGTVTAACLRLRRQGLPARCWAAPVVY